MLAASRTALAGLLEAHSAKQQLGDRGRLRRPPSKALEGQHRRRPGSLWAESEPSVVLAAASSGDMGCLNCAAFYAPLAGSVHTHLEEAEAEGGEGAGAGQIEKRLASALA